jgi:hypothetical protein
VERFFSDVRKFLDQLESESVLADHMTQIPIFKSRPIASRLL